ncbi:MAG TPA: hypothetical protein P5060_03825 [Candidatus Absconditabacterales bacterium]|nr:hypothetical protein [Candidatus Absconditabacterales bacterium]
MHIMIQRALLTTDVTTTKTVNVGGVKAVFTEIIDNIYDVVLEINSQKFLLRISNESDTIKDFEVITTKGFVYDLTNNLVLTLKNLVQCLWCIDS